MTPMCLASKKQSRMVHFPEHGILDALVAVERTGRYHHPVKNAFAKAGFETRLVHPYATKQFRQPANPDNKTDDTDLAAIQRAAVNGFALLESTPQESWRQLQLFIRHRRDLVDKASALACQIREHLDAAMPGYAACFDKLWDSNVAFRLVRQFGSAAALLEQGVTGLCQSIRQQQVRFRTRTINNGLAWAKNAAAPISPPTSIARSPSPTKTTANAKPSKFSRSNATSPTG
jgi:transposase